MIDKDGAPNWNRRRSAGVSENDVDEYFRRSAGRAQISANGAAGSGEEGDMASIGFIGLGNMGGPMVANLIKAGHSVAAFDIVPDAIERAVAAGASAADSGRGGLAGPKSSSPCCRPANMCARSMSTTTR